MLFVESRNIYYHTVHTYSTRTGTEENMCLSGSRTNLWVPDVMQAFRSAAPGFLVVVNSTRTTVFHNVCCSSCTRYHGKKVPAALGGAAISLAVGAPENFAYGTTGQQTVPAARNNRHNEIGTEKIEPHMRPEKALASSSYYCFKSGTRNNNTVWSKLMKMLKQFWHDDSISLAPLALFLRWWCGDVLTADPIAPV